MSVCRGRLFFAPSTLERRSQDSSVVQTLNFQLGGESDGEVDSSFQDASMESVSPRNNSMEGSLPTRTPASSPRDVHQLPRHDAVSPIPFSFDESDDENDTQTNRVPPLPPSPFTPPHKKFRSLRLYDTPHTPKSLLQKAQRRVARVTRSRSNTPGSARSVNLSLESDRPQANINPFTPDNNNPGSVGHTGIKRSRNLLDRSMEDSLDEELEEDMPASKKLALHEINTSRYIEEFHEICKLGDGEFGSVYKCINRLDGCIYAIKKSKTPVAGSVYERTAMNEVYAHAVLGKHPHVVRYYSAWAENDYMYIQNEFCDGGSLADLLVSQTSQHRYFTEYELKRILLQTALGLRYIHSQNLVHLDVKPGNIFMQQVIETTVDSGFDEDTIPEEPEINPAPSMTYKIGDLGHVTSLHSPVVEEGDCRYLPTEILQEKFNNLPKADIFSLALTIWETGGGGELPKNGEGWHVIRRGELPYLQRYTKDLNDLLRSMVHPDPRARPSAATLVQHPVLCPFARKTRAQLRRELNEERFKNEMLTRKLQAAITSPTSVEPADVPAASFPHISRGKESRLIGRKVNRSISLTSF